MKPDRRPAGDGDGSGGQWVARQHPAPDLHLNAPQAGRSAADLFDELDRVVRERDAIDEHMRRVGAALLATQIVDRFPTATTVVLDATTSDSGDTPEVVAVRDRDGHALLDLDILDPPDGEVGENLDEWNSTATCLRGVRAYDGQHGMSWDPRTGQCHLDLGAARGQR